MDIYKLNDFELIYMVGEGSEIALNLLFEKYKGMIYSKINQFKISGELRDDFYSEGLMALYTAIKTFNPAGNAIFYYYAELLITRRFVRIYKKYVPRDIVVDNIDFYIDESARSYENKISYYDMYLEYIKDDMDKAIYEGLYKKGYTPEEISTIYNIDIKKVYNIIQKIKRRLRSIKY